MGYYKSAFGLLITAHSKVPKIVKLTYVMFNILRVRALPSLLLGVYFLAILHTGYTIYSQVEICKMGMIR
jgi:hypothetical protein